MKVNPALIFLLLLALLAALLFTAAQEAYEDPARLNPTAWQPSVLTPEPIMPTLTPGWWDALPSAVPISSPTPR
jgi:hypothetical protein